MKQLLLAAALVALAACQAPKARPVVPTPPPADPCEPVIGQFPTMPVIREDGVCPPMETFR